MSPDFQIVTSQLCLRLITHEEAESFQALIKHSPSLHQWIDWCHSDFSLKQAENFILATRLNWVKAEAYGFGIYLKPVDAASHSSPQSPARLVGMVALNEFYHTFNMASIGYWVADEFQQQGIARRAVLALAEFCFARLKLSRIEIVCDPENHASQALIERCGALKEGVVRNRFIFADQPRDGVVYSLIPEDLF